jgi:Uma2 family endonuclease
MGKTDNTINHGLITANTLITLGKRLEGKPCRAYESNLRVRSARRTLWAHPDISVICGPVQLDPSDSAGHTVSNPKLIVEVLSPSTEAYDRGEKFAIYRDLTSLEEYVLISQHEPRVETFLRQSDGTWSMSSFEGLQFTAKLRSLELNLPLAEVFASVDFNSQSASTAQG